MGKTVQVVGAAAFTLAAAAVVVGALSLAVEEWIVIDKATAPRATIGLLRSCRGSNCYDTRFAEVSSCDKFESDVKLRFEAIVGMLATSAILAWLGGMNTVLATANYRHAAHKGKVTHVGDDTKVGAIVGVLSFLGGAGGVGVFQAVYGGYVNCGVTMCQPYLDLGFSCDLGLSYSLAIAAACIYALAGAAAVALFAVSVKAQKKMKAPRRLPHRRYAPAPTATQRTNSNEPIMEDIHSFEQLGNSNTTAATTAQTTEAPTPHGDDAPELYALPAEGDWVRQHDADGVLYYSEEQALFFDAESGFFYDGDSEQWYDSERDMWFAAEDAA
jgi:hypothetical protein